MKRKATFFNRLIQIASSTVLIVSLVFSLTGTAVMADSGEDEKEEKTEQIDTLTADEKSEKKDKAEKLDIEKEDKKDEKDEKNKSSKNPASTVKVSKVTPASNQTGAASNACTPASTGASSKTVTVKAATTTCPPTTVTVKTVTTTCPPATAATKTATTTCPPTAAVKTTTCPPTKTAVVATASTTCPPTKTVVKTTTCPPTTAIAQTCPPTKTCPPTTCPATTVCPTTAAAKTGTPTCPPTTCPPTTVCPATVAVKTATPTCPALNSANIRQLALVFETIVRGTKCQDIPSFVQVVQGNTLFLSDGKTFGIAVDIGTGAVKPEIRLAEILTVIQQADVDAVMREQFAARFVNRPVIASVAVNGCVREVLIGRSEIGKVVACDRKTGQTIWETALAANLKDGGPDIMKLVGQSSPMAASGMMMPCSFAGGMVFVPFIQFPDGCAVCDMAKTGFWDNCRGGLTAIDTNTGKVVWEKKFERMAFGSVFTNDIVFTSTADGQIFVIRAATGDILLQFKRGCNISFTPFVAADALFFFSNRTDTGELSILGFRIVPGSSAVNLSSAVCTACPTATPCPVSPASTCTPCASPSPTAVATPAASSPTSTTAAATPYAWPVNTVLTVQEAFAMIQANAGNPNFVILDVRTVSEFTVSHIANSINIDFMSPDFQTGINRLDKSKVYLVYC